MLLVVPAIWAPQGFIWAPRPDESAAGGAASFHSLAEEKAFYAQHEALERELAAVEPERPATADFYVVAAGLYAGEDVFMKEIRMITALLNERFDASGRIITLINNPKTLHAHPVASRTSLTRALQHLAPGVTEMHVQPAIDTPEVHALTPLANDWIDDHAFVTARAPLPQLIESVGATLIGYRELRDAMRATS